MGEIGKRMHIIITNEGAAAVMMDIGNYIKEMNR